MELNCVVRSARTEEVDSWTRSIPARPSTADWDKPERLNSILAAMWDYSACVDNEAVSLADRFRQQAEKWESETRHFSSPSQLMNHQSYTAVLGMAKTHPKEIISLMLDDLQTTRRPWFWALSYLAQDNPVPATDAGKKDKMIEAWVAWGRKKGHI
jgi:hypothetical protein